MRNIAFRSAAVVIVLMLAALVAWVGVLWSTQRQWLVLQRHQMTTIKRLGEFPPPGWDSGAWKNALVTPYNVWGNVTYHPNYSHISNEEMRLLQSHLDEIVAETTAENSFDSVDRVFQLLLQRGRKTDFITGYREEFRDYGQRAP